MKLANYIRDGSIRVALVQEGMSYDIRSWAADNGLGAIAAIGSVEDLITQENLLEVVRTNQRRIEASKYSEPGRNLRLKSPVLHPQKIFLAAVNYLSHGKEQDVKAPSEPYFFTKFQNSIIGPEDSILIPRNSKKVDWEVELAVIIGKRGKYISKQTARDFIAGYTIANDVSFRDLQFPDGWPSKLNSLGQNWVKGKGLDNALPLGPWLVTADELKDPYDLDISLSVNDEVRQKSTTSEMVFKAEVMIEYLSAGITLEPGDIICTGTPLGVAAFTGVPYLKDGDIVEASIKSIGVLRNPVKFET